MTHPLEIIQQEFAQANAARDINRLAGLRDYFVPTEHRSRPFDVGLTLNPARFPDYSDERLVSDWAVEIANSIERTNRAIRFQEMLDKGYHGPIIVDDGDSWFQYPFFIDDTIDHVIRKYAVYSLSGAGYKLTDIEARNKYTSAIDNKRAQFFFLSAGGNDLLDGGRLAWFLHTYQTGMSADDVINKPHLKSFLTGIAAIHDRIFRNLISQFDRLKILCHGYDYARPRSDGQWLGPSLLAREVPSRLWPDVIKIIIDAVNASLKVMENKYPRNVFHVDCRGTLRRPEDWKDELHPTSSAFQHIAARFVDRMIPLLT